MKPTTPDHPTVVVIGAGLGGLSAAIALAARNYRVTVVEQNAQVGGKLNVLERDGFTFDLGPSIFTLPQYFESLFARAGRRMADYVSISPVTPHWRNFFEDGTRFDLLKDRAAQHAEFAKLPGDAAVHAAEFDRFLDYSRRQYDIVERGYFRKGLENTWEFLRFYRLMELAFRIDHRHSMADAVDAAFTEPHLRDVFQFFIKYVGSSALAAPGYMNLMPHIQFEYDLWYVDGGMYNLARGLRRLADELGHPLQLEIEPGRFLVAEAGALLAEVRAVKDMGANHFVLCDAGFNDMVRPAMYGGHHAISLVALADAAGRGAPRPSVVAGPLCESGDVFTQDAGGEVQARALPSAEVGDLLVFHDAGAYGSSMSSNYNTRPLAAEVLVDGDVSRLVRRRQTVAELITLED